jgi:hypothetical protein
VAVSGGRAQTLRQGRAVQIEAFVEAIFRVKQVGGGQRRGVRGRLGVAALVQEDAAIHGDCHDSQNGNEGERHEHGHGAAPHGSPDARAACARRGHIAPSD